MGPVNFRFGFVLYDEHLYSCPVNFLIRKSQVQHICPKEFSIKHLTHPLRIHLYSNILCGNLLQENKTNYMQLGTEEEHRH